MTEAQANETARQRSRNDLTQEFRVIRLTRTVDGQPVPWFGVAGQNDAEQVAAVLHKWGRQPITAVYFNGVKIV